MVQQKKLTNQAEMPNGSGRRDQQAMSFQRKEGIDMRGVSGNNGKVEGKGPNGNRSSFRTDAAISNSRVGAERTLKAWVPDASIDTPDGSLERPGGNTKSQQWDQFAENERLFGLTTDYDERYYTTTLNTNHPDYKKRVAAAEKISREIEQSAPATSHQAEERIMDFGRKDDNQNEEDKYSGVRRQDFPPLGSRENKYTPPARRAPTGQATVMGAPVDPAIISSQLKGAPTPKVAVPKVEEPRKLAQQAKSPAVAEKPSDKPNKVIAPKAEVPPPAIPASASSKPSPKAPTPNPTATSTPRTAASTQGKPAAAGTAQNFEVEVLRHFKNFANNEKTTIEKHRNIKLRQDKEVKLNELKKFAMDFKLSTPVPQDLVSIITKDPNKQRQIQEKALKNMEDIKQKAVEAEKKGKDSAAGSEAKAQAAPEAPTSSAAAATVTTTTASAAETRPTSRPTAPQHSSSPSGLPGRGPRSYNARPHYGYNNGNNRGPPHMAPQNQPTGNLAQRLRNVEQQKLQHPHMGQHGPQDMRLPPTGPANNADPSFGRRISGVPPAYLAQKLNPNSHEFRPNAFAQPFNPAAPSQGSSPRSSVNNIVEAPAPPPQPLPGTAPIIRRKTKAVDIAKCFILSHIETFQPPQGRTWEDNDGLRPSFDTLPTWRQLQEELEKPDSTMRLTYREYFEKLPLPTPNPPHAIPQMPHHHQLPFHLQHGAQNIAPRQSPHMPPMQMHGAQHGHVPHVPFSAPDDHRMMPSTSAQSFASPRMGPVPVAYPPSMNTPAVQYGQPVMQPYMAAPGGPQMNQFPRSFSNNAQFMPGQPHHMAPMMVQPGYLPGPNGMVAAGPIYPGTHPQFMPPGAVPPQPMAGSTGFPSPGRPAAPMMVHQGSHQGGQTAVYGMSPGMPYQQPAGYTPQQPQGKFSGQRPQ